MKRFVSVWLPDWPVTRLARAEPGFVPEDEPFALVAPGARGIRITALNAHALREGLRLGMALADARAGVPALRARPAEPHKDAHVLLALSQWAGRYGPSRNCDGGDGFWCDITGVAHLFGGEEQLLGDLHARLAGFAIPARSALAGTYGAAHALARFAPASARSAPFIIVPPGAERNILAALPVEALRLEDAASVLLRRLGLKRIGDLYPIPRLSLEQRFASKEAAGRVLLRLDQALGQQAEPKKPFFAPPAFVARRSFPEPLISSQGLEAEIGALCMGLAEALKEKGMGTRGLRVDFYRADATVGHAGTRMRSASADGAHFLSLLAPKLEEIDAGFGIDLLVLEATQAVPLEAHAPSFAQESGACDPAVLIDRLTSRLGQDSVHMLVAHSCHIPERSQRLVRALDAPPARGQSAREAEASAAYDPPWPYGATPRRPCLLLSRPERIAVVAQVPDGPPARFVWRRVERRVLRAQGPERIAPEWWRHIGRSAGAKRARVRDYYEIEDEAGAAYWVFRHGLYGDDEEEEDGDGQDSGPPGWFLHGVFA